jgi:hypothetical protein
VSHECYKTRPSSVRICTTSWLAFAEIAEAKARPHRRHVSDRYHRHRNDERLRHASPRAEDVQRYRQNRSGSEWDASCFSMPYLSAQNSCSAKGGGEHIEDGQNDAAGPMYGQSLQGSRSLDRSFRRSTRSWPGPIFTNSPQRTK